MITLDQSICLIIDTLYPVIA